MTSRLRNKRLRNKSREAYSPRERLSLTQYFLQEREKGIEAREIAAKLEVSVATLYRWVADATACGEASVCMSATAAIEVLSVGEPVDREKYISAVIALSVWMKWPTEPRYHDAAFAALVVAYVCQTTNATKLDDLDTSSRRLIESSVPLEMIWKSCTPQSFEMPVFGEFRIDNQPYTASNVTRDIVWYLLAHAAIERRERYRPSLNKALYLLQTASFRFKWRISRRTFDKFWKKVAPSAAFEFVAQDASSFNWSLDPADPLLSTYIDEIVDDREGVIRYLSRCCWATSELVRILHPTVLRQIAFPAFPEHLPALEMKVEQLPSSMIEMLEKFRGHDTEMYDLFDT